MNKIALGITWKQQQSWSQMVASPCSITYPFLSLGNDPQERRVCQLLLYILKLLKSNIIWNHLIQLSQKIGIVWQVCLGWKEVLTYQLCLNSGYLNCCLWIQGMALKKEEFTNELELIFELFFLSYLCFHRNHQISLARMLSLSSQGSTFKEGGFGKPKMLIRRGE